MMITQVYEIDLVRQEIVSIVYVSFYLNVTSWIPMPFVVYSYTSKNPIHHVLLQEESLTVFSRIH